MSDILEVAAGALGLAMVCYGIPFGASYLFALFRASADFEP